MILPESSGPFKYALDLFTRIDRKFFRILFSLLLLAICLLCAPLFLSLGYFPPSIQQFLVTHPGVMGPGLNLITILILSFWLGKRQYLKGGSRSPITQACDRFYVSWCFVWISWLIFYLYVLIEGLLDSSGSILERPLVLSAIQNSLNNLQTVCFILCYFFMSWPIVAAARKSDFRPLSVVVPLISAVVTIGSFECLSSAFAPHFYPQVAIYFEIFSAFIGGVAIALFASRLGSLLTGPVTISISLLFLYALVQTGYSIFRIQPVFQESILLLVIPLKVWLFVFVRWFMDSGRLMFYFHESIHLQGSIDDDWNRFRVRVLDKVAGSSSEEHLA